MKISDITPLSDSVYELEKGFGDQKLGNGDHAKLLLGSAEAAFTLLQLIENENFILPSSLEEDKLITLFAAYDGSYKDNEGKQQYLADTVLRAIRSMTEGQEVLIVEDKEGEKIGEDIIREGARIWVIKLVKIHKSLVSLARPTDRSQQSSDRLNDVDRSRNPKTNSDPSHRRRSPVPPALFNLFTFDILLKLWGPRLCQEAVDDDVRDALKEIHCQLPSEHHQLLCVGSWLFHANQMESDNWEFWEFWEFYRFTFHDCLEKERCILFTNMRKRWNDSTGENLEPEEMEKRWKNMIWAIGEAIKGRLSAKQYSYCNCVGTQPHSCNDLQRRVKLLQTLDKNNRGERAKHVIVAYTSLRIFDMIEEEFGTTQHPYKHHRQVVSNALKELKDGEGLSKGIKAKMKDIIAYEEWRLGRGGC